jgi:hypothetical protein
MIACQHDVILALDHRLRVLKNRIVKDGKTEKPFKRSKIVVCISKRVYLSELIGRYIEEREARKAKPKGK